jgi:uncharacterized repeat protein (TIGR03803 family)
MRNFSSKNIRLAAILGVAALITSGAQANKFKVLYSFPGGSQGWAPGALLRDDGGNFYGAASGGGGNCNSGCGILFRLTPDGTETVLHSFAGPYGDGAEASSPLIRDRKGNLFGTTYEGGAGNEGTVYELTAKGKEKLLHSFVFDGTDGIGAFGLLRDGEGNLYGTTSDGGAHESGTVFKLARDGTETILHAFAGPPDGEAPYLEALIADKAGNLYGTTRGGGAYGGGGTVFELASDGTETVLHSFAGSDGFEPYAGVIMDARGNIYGTTVVGGSAACGGNGCGTVFKLTPKGKETVLHAFTGGADGSQPAGCCLVLDNSGNLYGTTGSGGDYYAGVLFKLAPDGTETVIHAFTGGADGDTPGGLITDKRGNLYGTTVLGGAHGAGIVFELTN